LWESNEKKFCFGVESQEISSHAARYLLKSMLKPSDAGVENRWTEREEKLFVIRIQVMVQGKR